MLCWITPSVSSYTTSPTQPWVPLTVQGRLTPTTLPPYPLSSTTQHLHPSSGRGLDAILLPGPLAPRRHSRTGFPACGARARRPYGWPYVGASMKRPGQPPAIHSEPGALARGGMRCGKGPPVTQTPLRLANAKGVVANTDEGHDHVTGRTGQGQVPISDASTARTRKGAHRLWHHRRRPHPRNTRPDPRYRRVDPST